MTTLLKEQNAIEKRLVELLHKQSEHLKLFVEVLDKQRGVIENGGVENILAYSEAGERLTLDIMAIQRVVEPLEKSAALATRSQEILKIKTLLERLGQEARFKNNENKALLARRMTLLATEIKSMEKNPFRNQFIEPSVVNIEV